MHISACDRYMTFVMTHTQVCVYSCVRAVGLLIGRVRELLACYSLFAQPCTHVLLLLYYLSVCVSMHMCVCVQTQDACKQHQPAKDSIVACTLCVRWGGTHTYKSKSNKNLRVHHQQTHVSVNSVSCLHKHKISVKLYVRRLNATIDI
eukprot:GHVQ01043243.1.p2 GENE.GHVQ01043243.1~~GHVQ01043243.1.p2  ORF type:complete len:148 (-),score=12.41 GHVQ01043243.1:665-1108(-)